jgi:putative nucleotidyltransferase with HDIG domain
MYNKFCGKKMTNIEKNIFNKTPEELQQLLEGMNDISKKAEFIFKLGILEYFKRNFDKSIKYLEEAQRLFLKENNFVKVAESLIEQAIVHYKKSNDRHIRAYTLLNDAGYLIENQKTIETQNLEARIIHYQGIINYTEKQYSEALKFYKKAQEILEQDSLEYAKVLDSLGVFYLRIANYQIANKYLEDSLKIKRTSDNKIELSKTLLLMGRYYSFVENYTEAISYLKEAGEITKTYNDIFSTSRIYDELAKVYIGDLDSKNARKYSEQSLALLENYKESLPYAFSNCTYAQVLLIEQKTQEAIETFELKTNLIFDKNDNPRGKALVKYIQAKVYSKQEQYKKAIENLHEAVSIYTNINLNYELVKCYFDLSQNYNKIEDYTNSVSSLLEALRITRLIELPFLTQRIEDILYKMNVDEWANVIDKTAKKEKIFFENRSLLETLDIVGSMPTSEAVSRDPLLALLRIGRSIAAETDVDTLMEIIAEETKTALDADRCTVFLLDKDKNELWSKVALGMGTQTIRFSAEKGLAGHVVTTGETVNIKDAYNDHRFNKDIDKKTGYTTKTMLCMPVRNINHEIVGVFQVLNKLGGKVFSDDDEDLLIAIGSNAGIALENARLFQKQQLMLQDQKKSFTSFINTLAASIDARDKITAGHSLRVKKYTKAIAEQLKMNSDNIEVLEYAATLHDIGKIGIKDDVLCKMGKLTSDEYKHIQEHAQITHDILSKLYFEEKFKSVPEIASSHHEKFDGSGYFRGTKGQDIPLGGRILTVSDVFDAVTSKRHYRKKMPFLEALEILKNDSGSHFDGSIVEAFFEISLDKILNVILLANNQELDHNSAEYFSKYTVKELYEILKKNIISLNEKEKTLRENFNSFYFFES